MPRTKGGAGGNTVHYVYGLGGKLYGEYDASGAFGKKAATGSATVNLRFPGQSRDSETGLHYNWNRYYNPAIRRYVSSDPIGLAGGLNTFGYAGQSPALNYDPEGLEYSSRIWRYLGDGYWAGIDKILGTDTIQIHVYDKNMKEVSVYNSKIGWTPGHSNKTGIKEPPDLPKKSIKWNSGIIADHEDRAGNLAKKGTSNSRSIRSNYLRSLRGLGDKTLKGCFAISILSEAYDVGSSWADGTLEKRLNSDECDPTDILCIAMEAMNESLNEDGMEDWSMNFSYPD